MAAIVHVKRHLDEEPLDALILNCKKRKTSDNATNDLKQVSAVLRFAGTVNEKENIVSHIEKHSLSDELKEQYKKHAVNITDKVRNEKQETAKNNRYKVVNCFRSIGEKEDTNLEYTVFEIESHRENIPSIEQPKFVYDLYYTNSDDFGDANLEDYISIHPFEEALVFGSLRDNGFNDKDSEDDSEDSNCENHWRNDYPDESDMESIQDDDILKAVENLDLNDDLSSDDGEEGFVYSIDSESAGFEEDIDDSDVRRYGEMYARFKAKSKQTYEVDRSFYYGDIDDEDSY